MDVQATLLYRTLRPVDMDALVEAVNAWVNMDDLAVTHVPQAGDQHVLLSNPKFHAVLSITKDRLTADDLGSALAAPINTLKDFDHHDALVAHRMFVTVTIGDGPMHVSEDVRAWMNKMGKHQQTATCPLDHKLAMLNAIVQVLVGHDLPEMVHWSQSDMLFSPDEVLEAADMLFPLPLVIKPTPFQTQDAHGVPVTGIRLDYSATFAGRTIVMEPSTLPLAETLGMAMWLFYQKTEGQVNLEHGAEIAMPGFPRLFVQHQMPDGRDRHGRFVIGQAAPDADTLVPAEIAPVLSRGRIDPAPHYAAPMVASPTAPAPAQASVQAPAPVAAPAVAAAAAAPVQAPAPTQAPAVSALAMAAQAQKAAQAPAAASEPAQAAQTAPAAETDPKPAEPVAKGWANAGVKVDRDAEAAKQTFAAASGAQPMTAAALKPALAQDVPVHHKTDAAAGLAKAASPAAKPALTKATAPAGLVANQPTKPTGLARLASVRGLAGIAAVFLLVAAGLTVAPKLLDSAGPSVQAASSFMLNAGPALPGQ